MRQDEIPCKRKETPPIAVKEKGKPSRRWSNELPELPIPGNPTGVLLPEPRILVETSGTWRTRHSNYLGMPGPPCS